MAKTEEQITTEGETPETEEIEQTPEPIKASISSEVSNRAWGDVSKSTLGSRISDMYEAGEMSKVQVREVYAYVPDEAFGTNDDGERTFSQSLAWGPHHEVSADGTIRLNSNGVNAAVGALAGARSEPNLSSGARAAVKRHLRRHHTKHMGTEVEDLPEILKRFTLEQLLKEFPMEPEVNENGIDSNREAEETEAYQDLLAVKSIGKDRVGAYAVLWGDPKTKDLTREYFTPKTDELTIIYDTVKRLPYFYQHTMDDKLKTAVVGIVDTMEKDDVGIWYEAQLTLAGKYREMIDKLIGSKKLGTSTGTFPQSRKVARDGHIQRWPIVEVTATPTPAEFRMLAYPVSDIKASYEAIGFDDIESTFKALGLELSDQTKGAEEARLRLEVQKRRAELLSL